MVLRRDATSLDGRVAVVTGAGSGIGRGIALGLAAFGARVAVWEKDADRSDEAAEEAGGLSVPTDVRDPDQVDAALAATVEALDTPTILINNAGGVFWSPLLETSPNGWDALIRANLGHVLLCTQRVARALVAEGRGGSIVNISTVEGVRAAPGFAAYAAAKAGVMNLTKTAALELAPHGIRVNGLAPDVTATEGMLRTAGPGFEERTGFVIPMGRVGHVDEMAGAAVFLASDLGSYVTGQTIHVDGGTSAAGGWYHHPEDGRYVLGAPGAVTGGEEGYVPSPLDFVADNVALYESTGGAMGATLPDTGRPVVILTTRGARSGAVRKTPLMRVAHDGRWLLVGSMGGQPRDPQWCWNLRAHPGAATVQDGPEPVPVAVDELDGDAYVEWWARAVDAHPDYADYQAKAARRIPLFLASPAPVRDVDSTTEQKSSYCPGVAVTAPERSPLARTAVDDRTVDHPVHLDEPDGRDLRGEVRAWLGRELPERFRRSAANADYLPRPDHEEAVAFCRRLHDRGWFVPHWPVEFGGGGLPVVDQVIVREELAYAGAPLVNSNGVNMLAPVLFRYGTVAQQEEHLPGIARSEVMWAQGYSEPEAGSDLASLRMRAERRADGYVLNGQKTWTSNGRLADWIFVLARTDPSVRPQAGISFFLVDMATAGIDMRPIRSLTGYSTFAEEFFEDVWVPDDGLVGDLHDGWRVAKALLDAERTNITRAAQAQRFYDELIAWCRTREGTVDDPRRHPVHRDALADLAARIAVGRALSYRIAALQATGRLTPAFASLSKLYWSAFATELKDTCSRMLGPAGLLLPDDPDAVVDGHFSEGLLLSLLHQIGGGTGEIQRNVIGEVGLGLPREPR